MKNIYLIGDSIRFGAPGSPGYGVYVKETLEGKAKVYAPEEKPLCTVYSQIFT